MEITPNSIIYLYTGIPLDPSYNNTLWFETLHDQETYFGIGITGSFVKGVWNRQYYTRVNRGQIKLKVCADEIYDCNYLSFKNTNYGDKWFYAFITSIEWVNNEVSLISFEIDVMQTYMFDAQLMECYVEREHSTTDNIGDNLEDEPIPVTRFIAIPSQAERIEDIPAPELMPIATVIGVIDENRTQPATGLPVFSSVPDGKRYDGVFGGLTLFGFLNDADINNFIYKYRYVPDNIAVMFTCPACLIENSPFPNLYSETGYKIPVGTAGRSYTWNANAITGSSPIGEGSFIPKNKKLYTFPYNFYNIHNSEGTSLSLRYEFFDNLTPSFRIGGNLSYPASAIMYPLHYKNLAGNFNEKIIEADYPMCSWNSDYFTAWLSQQAMPVGSGALLSMQASMVGQALNTTGFYTTHGSENPFYQDELTGAVRARYNRPDDIATGEIGETWYHHGNYNSGRNSGNAIGQIGAKLGEVAEAGISALMHADIFRGNIATGQVGIAVDRKTFRGCRYSIKEEQARRIDSFFSRYGYATNKNKIPNTHARSRYTYVKTMNCFIIGKMPSDAINIMENVFNRGITFWADYQHVGVYPQDGTTAYDNLILT